MLCFTVTFIALNYFKQISRVGRADWYMYKNLQTLKLLKYHSSNFGPLRFLHSQILTRLTYSGALTCLLSCNVHCIQFWFVFILIIIQKSSAQFTLRCFKRPFSKQDLRVLKMLFTKKRKIHLIMMLAELNR